MTAPLLNSGRLPRGFDPNTLQTLDPPPMATLSPGGARTSVKTVPVDPFTGNPAVSAINSAAPASSSYYPPEVLSLYDNAAAGGPIGGDKAPAPPYSGSKSWAGWTPPPVASGGVPMPAYDPNNPYADYSGVDYSVTDPGMSGVDPFGGAPGQGNPMVRAALAPLMRPGWTGPRARANTDYEAAANPYGSKFTKPIGGGHTGPSAAKKAILAAGGKWVPGMGNG